MHVAVPQPAVNSVSQIELRGMGPIDMVAAACNGNSHRYYPALQCALLSGIIITAESAACRSLEDVVGFDGIRSVQGSSSGSGTGRKSRGPADPITITLSV